MGILRYGSMLVLSAFLFPFFLWPEALDGTPGVTIQGIRFGYHAGFSRVVVDLSTMARYELLPDPGDGSVVIKVHDVSAVEGKKVHRSKEGIIGEVEVENVNGMANIKVLLKRSDVQVTHFSLTNPSRIVLDIRAESPTRQAQRVESQLKANAGGVNEPKPPSEVMASNTVVSESNRGSAKAEAVSVRESVPQNIPEREDKEDIASKEDEGLEATLYKRALSLFEQGEYTQSLKELKILTDNSSEGAYGEAALFLMGDIHFTMGEGGSSEGYEKAIDAYRTAIRGYPQSGRAQRALLNIGKSYEKLQAFYEAEAYYKSIALDYPDSEMVGEAYYRLAEMEFKAGRYEEAAAHFKKVLVRVPVGLFAGNAAYRLGDSFYQQNDEINARSYYEKAMKDFPQELFSNPQSLFNLGDIYFGDEEYEKAGRIFLRAVNLFPGWDGSGSALVKLGDSYYHRGDAERAIYFYSQAITKFPESEAAMIGKLRLADISLEKLGAEDKSFPDREEAYEEPLRVYREVAKSDVSPRLSELALFKLGSTLLEHRQYQRAVETLKQLLRDYPDGLLTDKAGASLREALKGLIDLRYAEADYVSVIVAYQEHRDTAFKGSHDAALLYEVGDSFERLGLYEAAAQFFETFLNGASDNLYREKASFQLGRLNLMMGNEALAEKLLSRYVKENPEASMVGQAYKLLGDLHYARKDFQRASSFYKESLRASPEGSAAAETYYLLGNSLRKLGNYSEAANAYMKVVSAWGQGTAKEGTPNYLKASHFFLADSLYYDERFSESLERYEQAASQYPDDESLPWTLYMLGQGHERLGFQERAMEAYRKLEGEGKGFWAIVAGERASDLSWSEGLGNKVK